MPSSRSELAAAQVDGVIYVPGGFGNNSLLWTPTNAFEVFLPSENRWLQRARLPGARDHMMTTAHNGRVFVFGGNDSTCECDPAPETWGYNAWSYDPATDSWTTLASMPEMRTAGAAVSLGDYIYIVGGWGIGTTYATLRYDPATNSWATLAPLNQQREHTNAVAYGGRIYALAGRWEEDGDLKSVEIYDPATDTWTMGPAMRDARAGHAAAVVGEHIYVIGGELIMTRYPEELVTSGEVYDPAVNRWVERFELPQAVHGVSAVTVDGVLYMIGGSSRAGGVNNSGNVWAYRP
jgi:N-acetylneuraminic acid mutarotase